MSPELRSRKAATSEVGDGVGLDISGQPELQGHEPSTRGVKKRALLAAMWQQLSWWGFSRREASELVPDDNLNRDANACVDRVRKRIADRDWRTIRPWFPDQLDDDASS